MYLPKSHFRFTSADYSATVSNVVWVSQYKGEH